MGIRFRFAGDTGKSYAWSCERLDDHALFDFAAGTFAPAGLVPDALKRPIAEDPPPFLGRFRGEYSPTPGATWWRGEFVATIHETGRWAGQSDGPDLPLPDLVIVEFSIQMRRGEGEAAFPPFFSW